VLYPCSMADYFFIGLLLWHVISVIAWYGSLFAFVFAIYPSLRSMTLEDQQLFLGSFMPKFSRAVSTSAVSSMLAGLLLFSYINTIDTRYMPSQTSWIVIAVGAILGLVSGFVTLGGLLPISTRLQNSIQSAKQVSPGNDGGLSVNVSVQQQINPVRIITRVIFAMLSIAIILMILAFYV
jgi:hypothetical protein